MNIRCRLFGWHDWFTVPDKGRRYCMRCRAEESYSKQEQHDDPDAEKGEVRVRIVKTGDGIQIVKETYSCTAQGPDSEYWSWWSAPPMTIDNEEVLAKLHEATAPYHEEVKSRRRSNASNNEPNVDPASLPNDVGVSMCDGDYE